MTQKSKLSIVLILILVIAIVAIFALRNKNKVIEEPLSPNEVELNRSAELDSTTSINTRINNIDLNDGTDEDIKAVDEELMKL